jgi:ABC-2 type transport system permease protein
MNIFRIEFRMYIRSTIIWSASMILLLASFMVFYPSFSKDAQAIAMIMENYPKELLEAFGMSDVDLSTVEGYFSMTFLFVQLCLAIQASNLGFSILSVEERERTADFLFSKPVKRIRILTQKTAAALLNLIITNIFVWIGAFITIEVFRDNKAYDRQLILIMLVSIILFQLFFLSVGMLMSIVVKKVRNVLSYSLGLSFGMYILSAFNSIVDGTLMAYLTPFKYFEPSYIIRENSFDIELMIVSVAITIAAGIMTYIIYLKRDIRDIS